ncbi:MAG: hypothetical protein DYH08_11015 [Actinobacteria bacterium ATB1]|nr:hypothetical protein [Actinobacteria bacterium ATB1]
MLAHVDGHLYVTSGRWCHKVDSYCRLVGSAEMPRARPYNCLVPLNDGCLAMKDLIRDGSDVSRCVILDPATMTKACPEDALPEASVGRLSAEGNFLYVVGYRTLMSFEWDGVRLLRDDSWSVPYRDRADPTRSYGWDVVIGSGYATWLDQGRTTMRERCVGRPSPRGRFVCGVRPSQTRRTSTGSSRSGSRTRV